MASCLESVCNKIHSEPEVECFVVDNNPVGETSEYVAALCKKYERQVSYVREPSPGLTAARHTGARKAKGEVISFLDDDVLLSDTWLEAVRDAFTAANVHLVGGPTLPILAEPLPQWIAKMVTPTPWGGAMLTWLSLLDIGKDVQNIHPNYIFGLNFSIRKNVLFEMKGFHPDNVPRNFQMWQGDGETGLTMKMFKDGRRADYVQHAKLFHICTSDRLTFSYFLKRAYYQGVADSFSALRSGTAGTSFRDILKDLEGSLAELLYECNEAEVVRKYTTLASLAAQIEHTSAAEENPKIRDWIFKEDYLDSCILGHI